VIITENYHKLGNNYGIGFRVRLIRVRFSVRVRVWVRVGVRFR